MKPQCGPAVVAIILLLASCTDVLDPRAGNPLPAHPAFTLVGPVMDIATAMDHTCAIGFGARSVVGE